MSLSGKKDHKNGGGGLFCYFRDFDQAISDIGYGLPRDHVPG